MPEFEAMEERSKGKDLGKTNGRWLLVGVVALALSSVAMAASG